MLIHIINSVNCLFSHLLSNSLKFTFKTLHPPPTIKKPSAMPKAQKYDHLLVFRSFQHNVNRPITPNLIGLPPLNASLKKMIAYPIIILPILPFPTNWDRMTPAIFHLPSKIVAQVSCLLTHKKNPNDCFPLGQNP